MPKLRPNPKDALLQGRLSVANSPKRGSLLNVASVQNIDVYHTVSLTSDQIKNYKPRNGAKTVLHDSRDATPNLSNLNKHSIEVDSVDSKDFNARLSTHVDQ